MGELIEQGAACHMEYPKYVIFADGRILSLNFKKHRILNHGMRGKYSGGFLKDKNGNLASVYIHRVVAETFYGKAKPGQEVRHLDGNPLNNHSDNLRWGTRKENAKDKVLHGTAPIGERHGMAKMTNIKVRMLRRLHKAGVRTNLLMDYFKISRMTHNRIINRKLWKNVDD